MSLSEKDQTGIMITETIKCSFHNLSVKADGSWPLEELPADQDKGHTAVFKALVC